MERILLLLILISSLLFAEREAGDYDRPSITYIPHLLKLGKNARRIPKSVESHTVSRVGREILLPYCDKNDLEKEFYSKLLNKLKNIENSYLNDSISNYEITSVMRGYTAPYVKTVVEDNYSTRAAERMGEHQKNSFSTDKAKDVGYTITEASRAINSAYIFQPYIVNEHEFIKLDTIYKYEIKIVNGVKVRKRAGIEKIIKSYVVVIKGGILWWRLKGNSDAKLVGIESLKTIGASGNAKFDMSKSYTYNKIKMSAKNYARIMAVNSFASGIRQTIRISKGFRLSGQILWHGAGFAKIDIGKSEGLKTDDVFWLMENREVGGKTVEAKAGWVMARRIGDSSSTKGYKSSVQVISGHPYLGEVLKEQPMSDFDIAIRLQKYIYHNSRTYSSLVNIRGLNLNNGYGPRIEIAAPMGRWVGIPQLFFQIGGGFSWGEVGSSARIAYDTTFTPDSINYPDSSVTVERIKHDITSMYGGHVDMAIMKRFYIKRVALSIQTGGGFQHLNFSLCNDNPALTDDDREYKLKMNSWGGFSNVFLEYSISPSIAFGGGGGYRYFFSSGKFQYQSRYKQNDDYPDRDLSWEYEDASIEGPTVELKGVTWTAYFTFRPKLVNIK